jgi:hypothetical protein
MAEILVKKRLICRVISARWLRFSSQRGSSLGTSRGDKPEQEDLFNHRSDGKDTGKEEVLV